MSKKDKTNKMEEAVVDPDISYHNLIQNKKYTEFKKGLIVANKVSVSGITNFVTRFECPCLINVLLENCFKREELYNQTVDINLPFVINPLAFIDSFVFGTEFNGDEPDPQTGRYKRDKDGFVTRKEVLMGDYRDRTLVLRNLDLCPDLYVKGLGGGVLTEKAKALFNHFRDPSVKMGCRILLVTDTPLQFPFKIRQVCLPALDREDAEFLIDGALQIYKQGGYKINLIKETRDQICDHLTWGTSTYTVAADILLEAISTVSNGDGTDKEKKTISVDSILGNLRKCIDNYLKD